MSKPQPSITPAQFEQDRDACFTLETNSENCQVGSSAGSDSKKSQPKENKIAAK